MLTGTESNQSAKYTPYLRYKSGHPKWIPEIPSDWDIKRIKHLARLRYGLGEPPAQIEGGVPFIRATDVERGKINPEKIVRVDPDGVPWSRDPELKANDILVVRSGAYTGDSAIVPPEWEGSIAGYDMVVRASQANPKFLAYCFLARFMLEGQIYLAKDRAAQPHLNAEELGNMVVAEPSTDEQDAIVRFLDRETAKIDELIGKKRRLIELLKEKRTAIISHAVTKGLDPNAPMKDSGIDWLGEVPAHWDVNKVGWVFQNLDHRRIPLSAEVRGGLEKIYPYYGASGIIDHVDDYLFDETLILVAEDGANLYSRSTPLAFIAAGQYWVNNHAHILRPRFGNLNYWEAVLQTYDYTPLITGAAQPKLTSDRLKNIGVPTPPADEQDEIAVYISTENDRIDLLSGSVESAVEKLLEFRSALISDAVTGKIYVRELV